MGAVRREENLPQVETQSEAAPGYRTLNRVIDPSLAEYKANGGPAAPIVVHGLPAQSIRRNLNHFGRLVTLSVFGLLLIAGALFAQRWTARMQVEDYRRMTNDGKTKDPLVTPPMIAQAGQTLYFNEPGIFAQLPVEGGEVSYDRTVPANVHVVGLQPGGRGELLFGSNWPDIADQPMLRKDLLTGAV